MADKKHANLDFGCYIIRGRVIHMNLDEGRLVYIWLEQVKFKKKKKKLSLIISGNDPK